MSKYKMRNLKTGDIYKMSKILKKMDIKFTVPKDATQEEMGVQLIQRVLENLHLAENEVNAFMAELVGLKTEEFAELPIGDVMEIFNLFKEQKDIAAFLKLAGK
ncbi:MAG TPA: hypothetical protein VLA13_03585 [Massilibacterium sp.]|nr:hypothetical protein [Massilibacterium sp.]